MGITTWGQPDQETANNPSHRHETGFTQRCQFTVFCLSYSKIRENFFFLKTSPIWEIIFSLTKAASKFAEESALSRWDVRVDKTMQRVGEFLGERHLLIIFICCSKMESFHRVPADCIRSHIQDNLRKGHPPPQINIEEIIHLLSFGLIGASPLVCTIQRAWGRKSMTIP